VGLEHFERTAECPLHRMNIAICGNGKPSLCVKCESEGYWIELNESESKGFFKIYECKKK
jgi:hypothetical protein